MLTAGIMDALDVAKAHIVGHDWCSSLAWAFALHPDRTLQLVAMSVGNLSGYFKGDHANEQKLKPWYTTLAGQLICLHMDDISLFSVNEYHNIQAAKLLCCHNAPAC
jgi:pimeloyl-ACP methyl ester carboxylesterase